MHISFRCRRQTLFMTSGNVPQLDISESADLAALVNSVYICSPVTGRAISEAGISDPLCVELVESLIEAMESPNSDVSLFAVRFFATREKLSGVLQVLVGEKNRLLDRIVSEALLERLCLGELSGPRLFPIVGSSDPQIGFVVLAASLAHNVCLARRCRATWMQAIEALNSDFDRSEIMSGFVSSFRSGIDSLIARYVFVWTQGMAEAVSAADELAHTDAAHILEAALSIDGVSDFPAFEFPGISGVLRSVLADVSSAVSMKDRVEMALKFLAKSVEAASEFVETTTVPTVVVLNLSASLEEAFIASDGHFDPDLLDLLISSSGAPKMTGAVSETTLHFSIQPGRFVIEVVPGIVSERCAEVRLTRSSDEGAVAFWTLDCVTSKNLRIEKSVAIDTIVLSLTGPGHAGVFEVMVGDIKLSVEFTASACMTSSNLKNLEATEINLPISSMFVRSSMPTIPLLPNPRIVLYVTIGAGGLVDPKFEGDLVNRMDATEAALRDVIREVLASDVVVVDVGVIEAFAMTAGAVIGASARPVLIIANNTQSPTLSQLVDEGLVQIFHSLN